MNVFFFKRKHVYISLMKLSRLGQMYHILNLLLILAHALVQRDTPRQSFKTKSLSFF